MLACTTVARPGHHATVVRTLRAISSNSTRPRAGPSHFEYPCASAYNNILLRRRYTTPAPTPSSSSSTATSSTNAPPPPPQSEKGAVPQKKPKLDLGPTPIKPKPPSSTTTVKKKAGATDALKATAPPVRKSASNMKQLKAKSPYYASTAASPEEPKAPPAQQQRAADTTNTAPLSGLGAAKAEAMKAVQDAEAHGILKPPPEGANWARRALHQAIQLAKFYFRGVKLVWSRRAEIAAIKERIQGGGAPLTRAEYRLMTTQSDDVRKIIPFLIIALILEEVIPLIAIYAPGMLPSTCILPSQRDKIEAKRVEKAAAFRKQYRKVFGQLKMLSEMKQMEGEKLLYHVVDARALDHVRDAPMALCGLLGLSTLGPDFLRKRRIMKRLDFLQIDDILLRREVPKPETMQDREIVEALQERGIPTPATQSRAQLNALMSGWVVQAIIVPQEDAISRRLALILTHA